MVGCLHGILLWDHEVAETGNTFYSQEGFVFLCLDCLAI